MNSCSFLNLRLSPGQLGIMYLGQVGFLMKYNDKYTLIDGYLTDSVDKNASGPVQWIRNYAPPVSPEALDFVDYVFCTHAHGDHMDPETLSKLAACNRKAVFFVSNALRAQLVSLGIPGERCIGLHCETEHSLCPEISVRMLPSAHEQLHFDAHGDPLEAGFLFTFGSVTLYHAGDCCPYPGLEEKVFGAQVMLLPVNGRDYYRTQLQNIIGNFTPREAILLAKRARAKLLIPTHYDLYEVNRIHPSEFITELFACNPAQRFHMFAPGEAYIFDANA